MIPLPHRTPVRRRGGFTLLEVLVAMTIMALAFSIIWTTYSAALNGWRRGRKLLDQLHQGDVVVEQLVGALRSTALFSTRPEKYGFWLETHGSGAGAADSISWVTSGSTFLPPDSPLAAGLHRLKFSLETDDEGRRAVAIRAYPHLADEEDLEEPDPWYVSTDEIQGFQCRTYNIEDEDWDHEWEDTNSVPRLVELTFTLKPTEEYGEPQVIQRLVEIPIAPPLDKAAASAAETAGGETTGGAPGGTEAGQGSRTQTDGAKPVRIQGTTPGAGTGKIPGDRQEAQP